MKKFYTVLLLLGIFILGCGYADAATIVVSDMSDMAFRTAVANTVPGDEIAINPPSFTNGRAVLSLQDTILIDKNLTISGPENGMLVINGNQKEIFTIGTPPGGCHVLLRRMTLTNGAASGHKGETLCTGGGGGAGLGGAIYVNFAILTCQDVNFENNAAYGGSGGDSGAENQANGGKGGGACCGNLIYPLADGTGFVRGGYQGGVGGEVNTVNHVGGNGGYACGGGGGVGEILLHNNAAAGGNGGWASGGGGGGAGNFTSAAGGIGGEFGGTGGAGVIYSTQGALHGGGGGGAGLGGAIFVDSNGGLNLERCSFRGNQAVSGKAGVNGTNGKGKGGAIFAKPGTLINLKDVVFTSNSASDSSGNLCNSGVFSDTMDVYGTVNLLVSTSEDQNDGFFNGTGYSLREALQASANGVEIIISKSLASEPLVIDPAKRPFVIEKKYQNQSGRK